MGCSATKILILISLPQIVLVLYLSIFSILKVSFGHEAPHQYFAFIFASFSSYVPSSPFLYSTLRQVHSLLQSDSSTGCDLVLSFSISSILKAYFISRVYKTNLFAYEYPKVRYFEVFVAKNMKIRAF